MQGFETCKTASENQAVTRADSQIEFTKNSFGHRFGRIDALLTAAERRHSASIAGYPPGFHEGRSEEAIMTENELLSEVRQGVLLIVGEYRGSHAEEVGYVDKKFGTAIRIKISV